MSTCILVVDDSPTIRHVVSTLLERHGYEPKVASDGQDAYDALASGEVKADLVLVDFVMPRMNGYQLCRAIRDNPELAALPVVLMSAKGDRIRDQFAEQTGALDAITKPFDAQALVAVVENALRRLRVSRGSSARLPELAPDDPAAITGEHALVQPEPSGSILAGDLGAIPIGAILQLLQAENQTGVLVCSRDLAEVRATFRNGWIDLVQSTGAGDEFRVGRYFVEEGILRPDEIEEIQRASAEPRAPETLPWGRALLNDDTLERTDGNGVVTVQGDALTVALELATHRPTPLGTALVAAGKITEPQLRSALTRQSSELLYEVLRWSYGRFELRREPPSELAQSARLQMPVASVVMEGFRRVDEWRAIERTLGSFDAILVRDGATPIERLEPREQAVLDAVDGDRSVRGVIVHSHVSSFDVCRILVQFLEARVLRRRGQGVRAP